MVKVASPVTIDPRDTMIFMQHKQKSKLVFEKKIKSIANASFAKYQKTYQLLEEYDRSPETTPEFKAQRRALQNVFRRVST